MDVLARAVNAALFVSHGIREDSHVMLHLMGGDGPPRRIWLNGSILRGVRPDERSIAGQIKGILKEAVPPRGRFDEFTTGILHSGGGLGQTIEEWVSQGVSPVVLDADGRGYSDIPSTTDLGFVISDDKPLTEDDRLAVRGAVSLSLGKRWLQGHSCIAILHHLLDGN
jgi:tRNA (pseudouridine54-N1)-methyltransferase